MLTIFEPPFCGQCIKMTIFYSQCATLAFLMATISKAYIVYWSGKWWMCTSHQ